ncbi:MAG: hypothetical protein L0332_15165 [Chloroflexi bacterium]|nr:hypothetical protein [Chloroflexota bacterium]MCI0577752.1 hypothetical protein [Chloroflexota bacterium]MCI0644658.1 hypothetical protein [Chloroflexota bacterium]MCI0728042.1 hypothetical protein [Chloroflexota bacterium]
MKSLSVDERLKQLPRRKRLLFHALFLFLSLSPLLMLEVYVRASRPHVDLLVETGRKTGPNPLARNSVIDAFAAYRPRPGLSGNGKTVNSHGFMSTPELAVAKPPGVIRIVFLGGSATAGMGRALADEETWPWQATDLLRVRFPEQQFEFINGAFGGYTSFESYGRLWSRIRFFSPDIIVVYHGWNEMYYFDNVDGITSWRMLSDGSWTFDRSDQPVAVYEPLWIDYLLWPSQTLSHLRLSLSQPLEGELGVSRPLAGDYDHRGPEIWRTNLRLLRETAALLGAELFVAKQATLIAPGLPPEQQARARYDFHGFDHDAHLDAYQAIYQVIDEEIPPERIIDVTPLSGQPEYFHDHVHPTMEGATRIAEIVAGALSEYLRLRPETQSEGLEIGD